MLRNHFNIAWRNLLKSRGYSVINILGLALGMTIALLIGIWIVDELSYNRVHKNYNRLAQLWVTNHFNNNLSTNPAISLPTKKALSEQYGSDFEKLSLASWQFNFVVSRGEKNVNVPGMHVEEDFPAMFTLQMLHGSYNKALANPGNILVAESLARTMFNKTDVVDSIIRLDDTSSMRIAGVYKDLPANSTLNEVKLLTPWVRYVEMESWIKDSYDQWDNHSFQEFVLLKNPENIDAVSKRIAGMERPFVAKEIHPTYQLHPMSKWRLYNEFKDGKNTGGRITFVWLFGIIGLFVLLLACINFMNLSTARSEGRAREVGIRKTLGSDRAQLITQFFSESIILALVSAVFACLLVAISMPWFRNVSGKAFLEVGWQNPLLWLAIIAFAVITGLLAGSYPALYLSSFKPLAVLKGLHKGVSKWSGMPRKILVVVQFTISIALIIGTLVVRQHVDHARERPVGYERDGLLYMLMSQKMVKGSEPLRQELMKTGVVESAATSSSPATEIWSNQIGFNWRGLSPGAQPLLAFTSVGEDYGKTIQWKMSEGRDFSREFGMDTASIIINKAAQKLIGFERPLGEQITWNNQAFNIIGVVDDIVMESPYEPVRPAVFVYIPNWASTLNIRLKPGVPVQQALTAVEGAIKKVDPNTPFTPHFADTEFEEKFRSEVRLGKLAGVFAFFAIFISCLGLFALASFMAERRTKEIGIRRVLGSSVSQVWKLLSQEFVVLTTISVVLATVLSWLLMRNWLSGFEYRGSMPLWVFVATAVFAFALTLSTVSVQAIRAALSSPVKSLRTE